jgi:2-polyprenyl-3-methyl-5-hydroxy-6-metoxy-1,4-benzoquinol methylase
MDATNNYLTHNKDSWNKRTLAHVDSEFYDNESFIQGRNSLNEIELPFLQDIKGKRVVHLQCHFGQDTISLARMGAEVTGIDLSNEAIDQARKLAEQCKVNAEFICCDVFDTLQHVAEKFDVVFASYGTIGWLPDINKWAHIVSSLLKPGGKLVFAEFHPVVWMY